MNPHWPIGTIVTRNSICISGVVVLCQKRPHDVCIMWESGHLVSYDVDVLSKYVEVGIMSRNLP